MDLAGNLLASHLDRLSIGDEQPSSELAWPGVPTQNPTFARNLETLARVARTDLPILIEGPTGAGKELVAKAVHDTSSRSAGPLQIVNCGAFESPILDSELFGHEKGSFTGAVARRDGLIASADGGTLFLDEIGELPLSIQPKLLRVLQQGEIRPVGSDRSHRVDFRIVAATNRDLSLECQRGAFREDLFYRLNAFTTFVPALSTRKEDILPLARSFLDATGATDRALSEELEEALLDYSWPGNIRELRNEVSRMVAVAGTDDPLDIRHLSDRLRDSKPAETQAPPTPIESERALVRAHLEQARGNKSAAARSLGMTREGLRKKMRRLDLPPGGYDHDD